MDLDPHTLQQVISRIEQQMRCPQCGKKIPVDFASVRLAGDDFLLLQLHCETCDAHIVLHAMLRGTEHLGDAAQPPGMVNASTALNFKEGEVEILRQALTESGGSFQELFRKFGKASGKDGGRREVV